MFDVLYCRGNMAFCLKVCEGSQADKEKGVKLCKLDFRNRWVGCVHVAFMEIHYLKFLLPLRRGPGRVFSRNAISFGRTVPAFTPESGVSYSLPIIPICGLPTKSLFWIDERLSMELR
jgi:hypothetical protein